MNSFLTFAENNHPTIYKLIRESLTDLTYDFVFPPPPKSFTAHLLGLVLGQRIDFRVAQNLRKKLYMIMGGTNFTSQDVYALKDEIIENLGEKTWKKWNRILLFNQWKKLTVIGQEMA